MFDRLYYIFYNPINRGFAQAERASFLLSIFLFFFIGAMLMEAIILLELKIENPYLISIPFFILGIAIFILPSRYFVKTGRYRGIIEKFRKVSTATKRKKKLNLLLVLVLICASVISFCIAGVSLSQYLSHVPK